MELEYLLKVKHEAAFSKCKSDLGRTTLLKHYCQLKPGPPISVPQYRTTPAMAEIIERQVDRMHREGVCEPSTSPYNFPILVVPKKDGTLSRFVIDLRRLNANSERIHHPMGHINDSLHRIKGRFFSQADLTVGFHQIPIAKSDRKYYAFSTPARHWQMTCCPQGELNATSSI